MKYKFTFIVKKLITFKMIAEKKYLEKRFFNFNNINKNKNKNNADIDIVFIYNIVEQVFCILNKVYISDQKFIKDI